MISLLMIYLYMHFHHQAIGWLIRPILIIMGSLLWMPATDNQIRWKSAEETGRSLYLDGPRMRNDFYFEEVLIIPMVFI